MKNLFQQEDLDEIIWTTNSANSACEIGYPREPTFIASIVGPTHNEPLTQEPAQAPRTYFVATWSWS